MDSAAGTDPMRIVCFGQQNWDYCWTAKQQICVRLAERGRAVLYVDPESAEIPLGPADTLRALAPATFRYRIREVAPGVQLYTHVHAPPLGWRLNRSLRPRRLAGIARRLDMRDGVALAIHPVARTLMDAVRPRARVYYAVDDVAEFHRDPGERRRMRREEDLMIRASDAVIAVSPRLHERFAALHPNAHLVQNAADLSHFAPDRLSGVPVHPGLGDGRAPTVGLVGQIDERVDQALLVHVARARPDWRIILAGRIKPGVDVSALEAEPNIRLLGYVDYADLPSVLGSVDVCTVPYRLTPLTHGCNPLKAWEYLATGRPVVATPLNALLPMRGLVTLADTHDAFLGALDAAIADPAEGRERRLAFARRNGWDARVRHLEEIFEDAIERADARQGLSRPLVRGMTLGAEEASAERLTLKRRLAFRTTRLLGGAYHVLRLAGRALRRRPRRVRSILVARRSRLGDTVVLLPMLRALRRHYPDARLVLGVQQDFGAHELVRDVVDEIRPIEVLEHPSRLAGLREMGKLFGAGFDLVVCGARYFTMREAWLTGAPLIAGVDDGLPVQRLSDVRVRLLPASHEVDNNLAVVEALDADIPDEERAPRLEPPPDAGVRSKRLREDLGIPLAARVVVLHPGSQKPSRRWPADRFAALVGTLLEERGDTHVILTGVTDEAGLVAEIREAVPEHVRMRAHDAVGRTNLTDLMALLSRADVFVCNDTGTMHVARALGVPLLALLGPENDRRWGPYPRGASPAVSLRHEVPCAPCVRWDSASHYCMRGLSVDEALAALHDLLNGRIQGTGDGITLDRRAVTHDWADLHARGHAIPSVALVTSGENAADSAYPDLECVVVDATNAADTVARDILDASAAALVAVPHADLPWTAESLGACIGVLVRDDEAIAADPIAGGYRSIDVAAALRTGGVVLRRKCLEGLAPRRRGADRPAPDAVPL